LENRQKYGNGMNGDLRVLGIQKPENGYYADKRNFKD
jgi:hypothetical protein